MVPTLASKILTTVALVASTVLAAPRPACQNNVTTHCEYDHVVVGAGASGLTVANRLSEDPEISVLVIEAGDFDQNEDFVTIPGLAGGAVGTKYDWNISYAANPSLNGRDVPIPLGKVVGGSTKLNRMVFDRGSKSDYDRWVTLGDEGWGWESLLPYFIKVPICFCNRMQHSNSVANCCRTKTSRLRSRRLLKSTTLPMTSSITAQKDTCTPHMPHFSGLLAVCSLQALVDYVLTLPTENMVEATKELGILISYDQASGDAIGGYYCPHNQNPVTQTRSSAREAYYETVKHRSNLETITGRQVTRLMTSTESGSARITGLEVSLCGI